MSNQILTANRHQLSQVVRRHPLASFLLLAFGLSWGGGALLNGIPLIAPDDLFIAGVLIAALVVTSLTGGRAALGRHWPSAAAPARGSIQLPATTTQLSMTNS